MTQSSSGIAGWVAAGLAAAYMIFFGLGAAGGSSAALAQNNPVGDPGPLEVRLFAEPGFSGPMQPLALEAGKPHAYFERLGDAQVSAVRSLQAGASVGVVLFRRAFFVSQDRSCAPTLGSDSQPELVWTGSTADFLPPRPGKAGVAALPDAGEGGYASAILYRRDLGPPPGALLMKRRRSYSKGCGNILRSFNFDRRFFPLGYQMGFSEVSVPPGCFNLKADDAGEADKNGPADMLRSDRIALLQPSDLDRRYGAQERRFRVVLFDGEDCQGETVTLDAPYRAAAKNATAADQDVRRDILLAAMQFRDRAESLRVEALDGSKRLIARAQPAAPTVSEPATSKPAISERATSRPAASKPMPAKPEPSGAAASAAATGKTQLSAAPNTSSRAEQTKPAPAESTASAKVMAPKAVAPKAPIPEVTTAAPKILPQSAANGSAAPQAALPTAKLEPMTALPKASPDTAPAGTATAGTAASAAGTEIAAKTVRTEVSPKVAPSASAPKTAPAVDTAVPTQAQSSQAQSPTTLAPSAPAQRTQAQLAQTQATPQPTAPQSTAPPPSPSGESGSTAAGTEVFTFPVYDVYRLNYCLSTKGDCGEPVANKWCQMKGFERAVAWQKDNNIGGLFPTFIIGDEKICAQYRCDGFTEITCGR